MLLGRDGGGICGVGSGSGGVKKLYLLFYGLPPPQPPPQTSSSPPQPPPQSEHFTLALLQLLKLLPLQRPIQGSRKSKTGWELTKNGCHVRSPGL